MSDTETPDEPKPIRDIRIDEMGMIQELVKQHADGLKTKVKVRMTTEGAAVAEGDLFRGVLSGGGGMAIDPKKFFKLFKVGKITEAQLISCITVGRDAAKQCLSVAEVDKISFSVLKSPSLTVSRKPGVVPTLVDAVQSLAKSLAVPAAGI